MSTNLKDSLKPTKGKLIISGFIFFLTIFLRGIVVKSGIEFLEIIEKALAPHYLLYSYITPPPSPGGDVVFHPHTILLTILAFIVGLMYWYLISCLIIFIYKRLKEKVRKR